MKDYEVIQEWLEDLLSEHHIEAQVDYQLLEIEENIKDSKMTFIYNIILVEIISQETIHYIKSEINKMTQSQFGYDTYVDLEWY